MGEIINLHDQQLIENQNLIVDLARFREGLLTERQVRKKYKLDNAIWERLGSDEGNALIEKVEEEATRRVRDGSAKREKAQLLVTKAPDVLSGILLDDTANARHRIDSCKVLNDFASNGPGETVPDSTRFIISINLGSDSLHFNKSIRPLAPGEVDPNEVVSSEPFGYPNPMPPDMIAAITAKKKDGGGNGSNTL